MGREGPGSLEGFGRAFRKSGRGQECTPEVRKGLLGHPGSLVGLSRAPGSPGGVGKAPRKSGRGWEGLRKSERGREGTPEVRVGLGWVGRAPEVWKGSEGTYGNQGGVGRDPGSAGGVGKAPEVQ